MKKTYKLKELPVDRFGCPLVCSGCAHAFAGYPFPGRPSGDFPCCFCTRNPEREMWQEDTAEQGHRLPDKWYDGSTPVKVPMDCYHSYDMLQQIRKWQSDIA